MYKRQAQGYVSLLLGNGSQKGLYDGTFGFSTTASTAAITELENSSNLWIYTPTGNDIVPANPFPQEFIGNVSVPEGGGALAYLLLASFACFAAMRIKSRNQLRNRETT